MEDYLKREYVGPVLRFVLRICVIVGIISLLDMMGTWVFLSLEDQWTLSNLIGLLTILLLLEGSITGAVGGFMLLGYSEYRVARQDAINPIIVGDQIQKWKERRISQQKWGVAMMIAGALLFTLGLLISIFGSF